MTTALTRRSVLAAMAAASLGTAWAAPARAAAARLTLPPPTGPHRIGTATLQLAAKHRELTVSVWYPARDVRRHPGAGP